MKTICKHQVIVKRANEDSIIIKCSLLKNDNLRDYMIVKKAFEELHIGHCSVPNEECPFAIFNEEPKCPLYEPAE